MVFWQLVHLFRKSCVATINTECENSVTLLLAWNLIGSNRFRNHHRGLDPSIHLIQAWWPMFEMRFNMNFVELDIQNVLLSQLGWLALNSFDNCRFSGGKQTRPLVRLVIGRRLKMGRLRIGIKTKLASNFEWVVKYWKWTLLNQSSAMELLRDGAVKFNFRPRFNWIQTPTVVTPLLNDGGRSVKRLYRSCWNMQSRYAIFNQNRKWTLLDSRFSVDSPYRIDWTLN